MSPARPPWITEGSACADPGARPPLGAEARSVGGAPCSPSTATPRRVLYAEDDRVAALLFIEALRERVDYEVQIAEDGAEALALGRDWRPHVLVLDAHLPDTSGLELLVRLRELVGLADVPAFVCSADEQLDDQRRHLAAGFCGYWVKPIDRQRLLADLDRLVSSGR